jgi:hypothetical protein
MHEQCGMMPTYFVVYAMLEICGRNFFHGDNNNLPSVRILNNKHQGKHSERRTCGSVAEERRGHRFLFGQEKTVPDILNFTWLVFHWDSVVIN